MGLTPKQKKVYEFIEGFVAANGFSPSYDEIRRRFRLRSYNSVQKYLRQLEAKGLIRSPWANMKRAVELVHRPKASLSVPLLGTVAAGTPIEPVEIEEEIEVPEGLAGKGDHFVLRVKGDSMVDEGISHGDLVVVKKQKIAENGQTVVAVVDGEATIKKFFARKGRVELVPANEKMKPIIAEPERVEIRGVVVALMRKY